MGLEKLRTEILDKSRSEAQHIVREAQNEAKRLVEEAQERQQLALATAKKDAQDVVARERTEKLSQARLQAKMAVADAREELLRMADDEVWDLLSDLVKGKAYPEYFEKLLMEGVKEVGMDAVLYVREKDAALAKKLVSQHGFDSVKVSSKALQCIGGVLVTSSDGRIRADNTLEARFNELKDERRKVAFDELFKK